MIVTVVFIVIFNDNAAKYDQLESLAVSMILRLLRESFGTKVW